MRRSRSFAIFALVILMLFAGCAPKESTAQPGQITLSIEWDDEKFCDGETIDVTGEQTVLDILTAYCDRAGIDYVNSGGYISSLAGLAEKEHGASSGWVYEINGEAVFQSAAKKTVGDGDEIVWRYTGERED
ncbi:DUF4430 domain-containing protein [Feifania hominis]|uniref:DUF4430 domain-containing protein n=1 Tax=Feifania hominis TaxID=2763660 RepID=A0A926HPH5_9FIRM|nr:DUF4430 domain-containing protein [Feifania hominis]MBC8535292.1 DUF4430 domain-containing protein [Feifania hominis]